MIISYFLAVDILSETELVNMEEASRYSYITFIFAVLNYFIVEHLFGRNDDYEYLLHGFNYDEQKIGFSSYIKAAHWVMWPIIISIIITLLIHLVSPYENGIVNHATVFAVVSAIAIVMKDKALLVNKASNDK